MKNPTIKLCLCPFLILLLSCGGGGGESTMEELAASVWSGSSSATYSTSTYPDSSWVVASPSAVNMTSNVIDDALNYAFSAGKNTQSVLIVRHGVIIAERYANFDGDQNSGLGNRDKDSLITTWSSAKSIASGIIGIVVGEGLIESIDESASRYLKQWIGTDKEVITTRDLLEMRSNLLSNNPSENDGGEIYAGGTDGDQIVYSLERKLNGIPGTTWSYSNEDSMLLGKIIEDAVGMSTHKYADIKLFSKIGFTGQWWTDVSGNVMTYCCMDTTPRSLARFGLLFARNGKWVSEQIVPEAWVRESTAPITTAYGISYGFQWWVDTASNYYSSRGLHNNDMYIVADKDLVVLRNSFYQKRGNGSTVRTGDNYHYTIPPDSWDDNRFIDVIINSISD